jgi:hypothetical protein
MKLEVAMLKESFYMVAAVSLSAVLLCGAGCSASDSSDSSGGDEADTGGIGSGMDVSWLYTKSIWIGGLDHLSLNQYDNDCQYNDETFSDSPQDINNHGFDRYTLPKLDAYDSMQLRVVVAGFRPVFCANGPGFQACATVTTQTDKDGTRYFAELDFTSAGDSDTSWKNATVVVVTSEDSFKLGPQATSPAQVPNGRYGMEASYYIPLNNGQCPSP